MTANDKPVLIYATFPDAASAEVAGRALVEAGLAACVNILPQMVSLYRWQGAMQRDAECVLIIKTRAALADRAIAEGCARHPYETPAFLILEVAGGSAPYIEWMMAAAGPET